MGNVAVLAILAADFFRGATIQPTLTLRRPRDRLPLKRRFAFRGELLISLLNDLLYFADIHVTSQFRAYDSGMYSGSTPRVRSRYQSKQYEKRIFAVFDLP